MAKSWLYPPSACHRRLPADAIQHSLEQPSRNRHLGQLNDQSPGVPHQTASLSRAALFKKDRQYRYIAHQKDCQQCPVNTGCLPKGQKRRYVSLSMYYPLFLEARERNKSATYKEEMVIRQTTAEGVFASQARLGWARSRLRRLWKVECEGYMSAMAHNLKKAVRRLESSTGPPEPRRVVAPVGVPSG